jgi:hypothetical protein
MRNESPPSSEFKDKPSKKSEWSRQEDLQWTTRRYLPEDRNLHNRRLKFKILRRPTLPIYSSLYQGYSLEIENDVLDKLSAQPVAAMLILQT